MTWQDEIPVRQIGFETTGLSATTMGQRAAGGKAPERAPLLAIFETAATR
jgi:hypothetical protein